MARPSKYSPEVVEAICGRLSAGEPLAVICREEAFPAYRTVKDWMDEVDGEGKATERGAFVSAAIARAREEGFDAIAAGCLEIADDARNDFMAKLGEAGEEVGFSLNSEHIQRSKLRIETRLKLLAKWDPKRYGEKMTTELTGPGGKELPPATVIFQPVAARDPESRE